MGHAIAVRTDYTAGEIRRFAQRVKDAAQARRLLAIAAASDAAGLGDPVQRAGSGRSHQYSFSGDAAQAQRRT